MNRESISGTGTVVVILDGDTDAGFQLALRLLAGGRRVAAIGRHAASLVRVTHGQPCGRALAIAGDVGDERHWTQIVQRVTDRFGCVDVIVRADDSPLRATA